ncbi:MAG: hypothetical protein U1E36_09690 [Rickettsiales bacterium]
MDKQKVFNITFILLLCAPITVVVGYYYIQSHHDEQFEENLTAAFEKSKKSGPILLSEVMPGDWSFVCLQGETL